MACRSHWRESVPGTFHELLIYLIRSMPGCAQALLETATSSASANQWFDAPFLDLTVVDSNLSVDAERELRADLVLVEANDAEGPARRRRGLVFEIQLGPSRESKERAWLAYCAEFWLREHVEPALIVVTDDDAVTRRASRPLAPAGPALSIRPMIVHCRDVVSVFIDDQGKPTTKLDLDELCCRPSLRGLYLLAVAYSLRSNSLATRHFRPLLRDVLRCIDGQSRVRYTDAVSQLSPDASELVESIMRPYKEEPYEFKNEYFRTIYLKGRAEGEARGEARGRAEGESEGIVVGQRAALKRLLGRRHELTEGAEETIDSAGRDRLERWIDQVADGAIPDELKKH